MIFAYKVRKSPAETLEGVIDADDEHAAVAQLRKLGYYPFEVTRRKSAYDFRGMAGKRLRSKDLALFARQMATLIGSGIGLAEALKSVAGQMGNDRFKDTLNEVRVRVEGGESLSQAMGSYQTVFPPLLVSVVSAGEAGGMLAQVFERAATHYESMEELRGKVVGALIYPAFLFLVGALSVTVLVTFVVPGFAKLFAGFGQTLPWTTRALLSISGFMASYWWLIAVALATLALAFYRLTRRGAGQLAWDSFKLEVPLVSTLVIKVETARFARTLAALLANGVPMLSALDVVTSTLGNRKFVTDLAKSREDVQKGSSLSEALGKHTVFPGVVLDLVRVGESSGTTPEMLEKVAAIHDRDVDRAARALTALLEPVLIILMAGCVAFVVMSILLPVFSLNQIVQ
jgi:type II secretion system protein F